MTKPVSALEALRQALGHFDSFGADHLLSELNKMGYHLAPNETGAIDAATKEEK